MEMCPDERNKLLWTIDHTCVVGLLLMLGHGRSIRTLPNLTFGKTYHYQHILLIEHDNEKRLTHLSQVQEEKLFPTYAATDSEA